jgi:hypothetical protein
MDRLGFDVAHPDMERLARSGTILMCFGHTAAASSTVAPHKVDRHKESGPDGVVAFPRPTPRDCPARPLEVTYVGIIFGSRRPCDLRTGPLWLAALYGVTSTVGMWGGLNGVEQIGK